MRASHLVRIATCFFGTFFCVIPAYAQYYLSTGFPEFSENVAIPLGSFNPDTGNLHIDIPLHTFAQRSGAPLTVRLVYNSIFWQPDSDTPMEWLPYNNVGWALVGDSRIGAVTNSFRTLNCQNPPYTGTYTQYKQFVFIDGEGTARVFSTASTGGGPGWIT
jgi:hypothetical protein